MKTENRVMDGVDTTIGFNYPEQSIAKKRTTGKFMVAGIITGIISLAVVAYMLIACLAKCRLEWSVVMLCLAVLGLLLVFNCMVYRAIMACVSYEIEEVKAISASKRKLIETAINHEIALQKQAIEANLPNKKDGQQNGEQQNKK